jgi:predicted nucleotidyltransferase component of viral defense system
MAALETPYWETVSLQMKELLQFLGQQSFISRFYLAGGTALSLQIGHRRSVDLDFFSAVDELDEASRKEIAGSLRKKDLQVIENVGGNLLMVLDGIRIGFFGYGYLLLQEPARLENVALASLVDIGLMKCDALISRGSRKDFYDLYFISHQISLENLLQLGEKKYPLYRDFALNVLESMIQFDIADRDVQPELLVGVSWYQIKTNFLLEAERLSQMYFGDETDS